MLFFFRYLSYCSQVGLAASTCSAREWTDGPVQARGEQQKSRERRVSSRSRSVSPMDPLLVAAGNLSAESARRTDSAPAYFSLLTLCTHVNKRSKRTKKVPTSATFRGPKRAFPADGFTTKVLAGKPVGARRSPVLAFRAGWGTDRARVPHQRPLVVHYLRPTVKVVAIAMRYGLVQPLTCSNDGSSVARVRARELRRV